LSPDDYERLAILVAQESAEVKAQLRSMEGRFDGLEGRFDGLEGRLTRVEVSGEQRGHLLEIVAERVTAVDRKVEDLRTEMNGNFAQVREDMAAGFGAHDARLRKLESGSTA